MTRAIVFIPPNDYARSAAICFEHLEASGYKFVGLVTDWDTVQRMFRDDEVTAAIVADPRDLDPNRKPRVEFASHGPTGAGKHWDERPRLIRRPIAGE